MEAESDALFGRLGELFVYILPAWPSLVPRTSPRGTEQHIGITLG